MDVPRIPEMPKGFEGRFVHACVVVSDINAAMAAYQSLLGAERPRLKQTGAPEDARVVYRGEPTPARAWQAFFDLNGVRMELLQPDENPSTWRDFLDRNGSCFHHIAYDVDDMDAAISLFRDLGAEVLQIGHYNGGMYVYIDTEKLLGVVLELLVSTQ